MFLAMLASPLAHADADAAYGDLANLYVDASTFSNSFGAYEDLLFDSDLTQNLFAASVSNLFAQSPSAATASDEVNAALTEGHTVATELDALETYQPASVVAATDGKDIPAIGDAAMLQEQINAAIADLPAVTAQDETNPLLVAELSALAGTELNLTDYAGNLGEQLANGSPAGLTAENTLFIAEGLAVLSNVQSTSETLTLLADLSSLGL
ncbi:hypothetical protein [Mycobacterium paraterrae]|uniref:Uncharacterized protein n=1 Tax=Mycobacterium paraterrae TaxID=577492 RepID=A0ABY3VDX7_9MYCO|nr:hypothetical protein [Mycobacterium paraterrae]UMB67628.1 hypothetical protein MKK62_14000 [Mycobacterium paraterrae]